MLTGVEPFWYTRPMRPILREKLSRYDLDTPASLSLKMGVSRQYASMLLRGRTFGRKTAERIGKLVDLPWQVVYEWQGNDHKKEA